MNCVRIRNENDRCEEETARLSGAYYVAVKCGIVSCCDALCNVFAKFVLVHEAAAMSLGSLRTISRTASVARFVCF